jgi:two-component system sensor histidine kinase CpxA
LLSRLNPVNSLFGKIVIWFWLSIATLLLTAFVLSRLIAPAFDVSQPSDTQSKAAEKAAQFLKMSLDRGVPIERALRRAAGRGQWQLILVNTETTDLITSFPPPMLPSKKPIIQLADAAQLLLVRTPKLELVGPMTVEFQNAEYKLFAGRLLRRDERQPASFGISLVTVLVLGSLLCLLLAWRLTKPIGELRRATQTFANGDLGASFSDSKGRSDEIGQLANDFNSMADKLSASMHQQQMLMANVSHELRTPLTRLQLAVAMLQDDNTVSPDKYLTRIEQEITQMDGLIAQILKLTRIENANNGLIPIEAHRFQMLSLADTLAPVLASLEFEASANHKKLTHNDIPHAQMLMHAESMLSAFENIARNAIKFARSELVINMTVQNNRFIVTVDDDGIGLAQEEMDKLFSPFYRAHENINVEHGIKGSGLGLAIAKASVSLHHGELVATRSPLGGLKLTMNLPICER